MNQSSKWLAVPDSASVQIPEVLRNFPEVPGSGNSATHNLENQADHQQENVHEYIPKSQADEKEEDQLLHQPLGTSHHQVHQIMQQDLLVDNILGSIRRRVKQDLQNSDLVMAVQRKSRSPELDSLAKPV